MSYSISKDGRDYIATVESLEEVEEVMRGARRGGVLLFEITKTLPFSFSAVVERRPLQRERFVIVMSGGARVPLERSAFSASQTRDEETGWRVRNFNIDFRHNHEDLVTDRGIVWVAPGNPTSMMLRIRVGALDNLGETARLIAQAEKAVNDQLLNHLKPAQNPLASAK